ncbi:MAG: site-specific integrase [Candidatus Caldarchaeum sp.]
MLLSVEDFYRFMTRRYALTTASNTVYRLKQLMRWLQRDLSGLLDQEMVVDFILSKPVTAGYRHNLLLVYMRFLRYAGEKPTPKILEALAALERLRQRKLPRIPSYTTCLAGLAALHGHTRTAYALALFGGLRLNEALSLRWTDVDLEGRQILIEKSEKRSEGSVLPIPDQLFDVLKEAKTKATNDYVCGGIGQRTVQKTIRRLRTRLKVEDAAFLSMKNLRHVFATRIYATTKDIVYTQRMLRHRSLLTTQRYVHMVVNPRTFDVLSLPITDEKKISELLAVGYEVALQTRTRVFLRRPRGL